MRDPWGTAILLALGVSPGAVAVLFAGFEVVERTWLGGADPKLLHALHLARGLTAALVATLCAAVVLFRRTGDPREDSELPPAEFWEVAAYLDLLAPEARSRASDASE